MPLYQALLIFLAAIAIALVAAIFVPSLRRHLRSPVAALVVVASALVLSAVSALVSATRHSGTGFTTSHGWPKPFYFRYLHEAGHQSEGWSLLFFLGNSLVFAAPLLLAWTLWGLIRR